MNYTGGDTIIKNYMNYTLMGPALAAAHDLFKMQKHDLLPSQRSKAIVVVTVGDLSNRLTVDDWKDTQNSAADIRNDGIRLMFAMLDKSDVQLNVEQGKGELLAEA